MPTPRHQPSDQQRAEAKAYAAVGVPHHDIALLLGITTKTLLKYYRHELDVGKAKANAQIGRCLFQQAIQGNTAAAIYWTKTQMGWRETPQVHELQGAGGGPIQTRTLTSVIGETKDDNEAAMVYQDIIAGRIQ